MWLSKREQVQRPASGALTGPVTLPGEKVGAWLEGEKRGVSVFAPGGYHWAPALGDQVLVLKAGQDGEQPCALGVPVEGAGLAPGEVLLTAGEAALRLTPTGEIRLEGNFFVNGVRVGPALEKDDDEDDEAPEGGDSDSETSSGEAPDSGTPGLTGKEGP